MTSTEAAVGTELVAAHARGDDERCVRIIEQDWMGLVFHTDLGVLSRVLFALPPAARRTSPLVGHLSELFGVIPLGSVRVEIPEDDAEIESLAHSDGLRAFVARATMALVARRVLGRPRSARAIALAAGAVVGRTSLAGLGVTAGPLPGNNVSDLKSFFHLQAGLAAQAADDPATAQRMFAAGWRERMHDTTGFASRGLAVRMAVEAAVAGDAESARSWLVHADGQPRTSAYIEDLAARGSALADFVVALDSLDPDEMAKAGDGLADLADREEQWPFVVWALARHAVLRWEPERALALLDRVPELFPRFAGVEGVHAGLVAMARAEAELALGHGNRALLALSGASPTAYFGRLTEARLMLLAGDAVQARVLAAETVGAPDRTHRARVEALLVQAVAELRLGLASAEMSARRAAALIEARGPLSALLAVPRSALHELAGAFPETSSLAERREQLRRPDIHPESIHLVRLTEREAAVLRELERGRSRPDIARVLFVSENTVKSQIRSLYAKLDATSGDDAVLRARELGLLGPPER